MFGREKFMINQSFGAFFVTLILCWSALSHAKEGFKNTADLPKRFSKLQDSVFLFLYDGDDKYAIGTAFLIAQDKDHYYFFTNNHVVKGNCESNGDCPHVKLYQVGFLEFNGQGQVTDFHTALWPYLHQINVVLRSENPDYAVLRSEKIPPSDIIPGHIPMPFKLAKTEPKIGERLYTIGFPNLTLRTCAGHGKIENQNLVYKRWSEGIYIGLFKSDDNADKNTRIWMGTTVDALGGNSGGPIFNDAGEVVAIMQRSASQDDGKGDCYSGDEVANHMDWESLGVILPASSK